MKKIFAILMILVYSLGTTGVAVAAHYCCGKLAEVHIGYSLSSAGNRGMEGCCRDVTHFYKVWDAQQHAVNDIQLHAPFIQTYLLLPVFEELSLLIQLQGRAFSDAHHSPPLLDGTTPRYIHLSVFRI